jgi:flagellar protein FlbD
LPNVIELTRINGSPVWLNPLLIEAVESTPDSVVTLINGHKYLVRETPAEIQESIVRYLAQIGVVGSVARGKEAN